MTNQNNPPSSGESYKPFLLLQIRAEDDAAQNEYAAICDFAGLEPEELIQVRLEQGPMPNFDLEDYSGIIIGGSPFNVSDDDATKSDVQHRVEAELQDLLDHVIAEDYPLLGLCYGLGLLGVNLGGIVDRKYGEGAGTVEIRLTAAGKHDPLLVGMPDKFLALTGHKEAISTLPPAATLLATSQGTTVQMIRVGQHVYATQFHPELDEVGLKERLAVSLDKGYCQPEEYDQVVNRIRGAFLQHSHQILSNFVHHFSATH